MFLNSTFIGSTVWTWKPIEAFQRAPLGVVVDDRFRGRKYPTEKSTLPQFRSIIDVGTLGGDETFPKAINATGTVVGDGLNASGISRAFIWSRASGISAIGTLGGPASWANDINDAGIVVGRSMLGTNNDEVHAFWYSPSVGMVDLHSRVTLGGRSSAAVAISAGGQVLGWSELADGTIHGFLLMPNSPAVVDLGTLGQGNSVAFDVNDSGVIVGARATRQASCRITS